MAANNYSFDHVLERLKEQSSFSRVPLQTMNSSQTRDVHATVQVAYKQIPKSTETFSSSPFTPWSLRPDQLPPSSPNANPEAQRHDYMSEFRNDPQDPGSSRNLHLPSSSPVTALPTSGSVIDHEATQGGESSSSVRPAEAESIRVKKEVVETSLSERTDVEIQLKPLKSHHRLALAAHAASHSILPHRSSRRIWSDRNNVSEELVTKFLNEIVCKNRKEKKGSKDRWKLPSEVVKPEVVENRQTKGNDKPTAKPPGKPDQNSGTVCALPSSQSTDAQEKTNLPPTQTVDVPMKETNQASVPTPSINTNQQSDIDQQDLSPALTLSSPGQINIPSDMTHEIMELLVQRNFFALVTGPFAITFEDMLNWPAFELKLRLHQCSLRPRFVWGLLKTFYFFF